MKFRLAILVAALCNAGAFTEANSNEGNKVHTNELQHERSLVWIYGPTTWDARPRTPPTPTPPVTPPSPAPTTIVDLVVSDAELSTLETAVVTAGLNELLSGPGPFTVFAPKDKAFEAVDPAVLARLLTPEFGLHLQDLLAYHVANGSVLSTDLSNGQSIEMLNGESVTVTIDAEGVSVNGGSDVEQADNIATNGIVHKIDGSVLIPSFVGRDLVDILASDPSYSTLVSLVQTAGLEDTLRTGTFTVLAPNNAAFEAVPPDTIAALMADPDLLTSVLTYHVIEGVAASTALPPGSIQTANGQSVDVAVSNAGVTLNGIPVTEPDVLSINGIVHGIGAVLIPAGDPAATAPESLDTASAVSNNDGLTSSSDSSDLDSETMALDAVVVEDASVGWSSSPGSITLAFAVLLVVWII